MQVSPIKGVDIGVGFMIAIGLIIVLVIAVLHVCKKK
jgi:tetrahydromethanopterin S-methyltransferase subunit G